jgi:hypothetical protein
MTDTPPSAPPVGATSLLGDSPTVTPVTETSAARAAAMAELQKVNSDPQFRELVARKDGSALNKLAQLQRTLASPTGVVIGGVNPAEAEARLNTWQEFADLGQDTLQQLANGGPVSKQEYDDTKRLKERLFKDKSWVRGYLDGDRKARQQMSLMSIILSSQIRDDAK